MTHRRAVLLMVLVTLLWSTAGVVSRHLDSARSFEVTFWRSAFNALALSIALLAMRGPALWGQLLRAPRLVWVSALCWAGMFTAFMVAITLTKVANVLVTMALGPLITALFSRVLLKHRLPLRTWIAILVATLGIGWMFGHEAGGGDAQSLLGVLIALGVPLSAAVNWTVLQHISHGKGDPEDGAGAQADMLPAVLLGAVISALCVLPLAWPFQASVHDLSLLALLGAFQLALPCLVVVRLSRTLAGPEIALIGQLEVLFGVLWAWLWGGEQLAPSTLAGGLLVLAALAGNEVLALRQRKD
jgi:drug/metabolite transporter (DMT)-like permease